MVNVLTPPDDLCVRTLLACRTGHNAKARPPELASNHPPVPAVNLAVEHPILVLRHSITSPEEPKVVWPVVVVSVLEVGKAVSRHGQRVCTGSLERAMKRESET